MASRTALQTHHLAKEVKASTVHLAALLDKVELEALNEYLRHVLLRLDESAAAGRFLR